MRVARLVAALGLVLAVTATTGPARPRIAAHRGGADLWPENGLAAFRGALSLGVDLVELDVHLTRDGEVVVLHDPTLDRTTTGRGPVRERTWAELAAVALRGAPAERVPRLRDVLELRRPPGAPGLLLEVKVDASGARYPGIEERIVGLLDETGLTARTTVMAFEWDTLERVRALVPALRLTALLTRRGAERLGGVERAVRLAATKAHDLGIERTLLSAETVATARAAGLTIGVWTVNAPDELRAALASGVDYVTTDRPDLALQLRGAP
jgi:glycerophosphoryl diester phosphodiesterase